MSDLNSTILIKTVNINGKKPFKIKICQHGLKKKNLTMCCLQKNLTVCCLKVTHFKGKETNGLKVK